LKDESLLGELAFRLAKSPEDIATESLAYVLARSASARAHVVKLAQAWASVPPQPVVAFQSQVGSDDQARPDLEGQDADGAPAIIFENKFWAALTDARPVSYLRRQEERGGVLCFVVPSIRLRILWPELLQRVEASPLGPARVVTDEQELRVAHVGEHRALAVTSWPFLLGQIRSALEAGGETALIADLRQLQGLASRMKDAQLPSRVGDMNASIEALGAEITRMQR
jgi:hypothetical protein